MLADRMPAIVQTIEQLPTEAQDEHADEISSALDEPRRQALLHDPERLERLRALADEAMLDEVTPFPRPVDQGRGSRHSTFGEGT
jgi:hypothetical protein